TLTAKDASQALLGKLTLSGTTGLTFITGSNGSATFTVEGTISAINTALNGLEYDPLNPAGTNAVTLTITTDDRGNTRTGGPLTDTDTVAINVFKVTGSYNDQPPVNTVPGAQSTSHGTTLVFSSANGNQVSTTDPDLGTSNPGSVPNPVKVTLSMTAG